VLAVIGFLFKHRTYFEITQKVHYSWRSHVYDVAEEYFRLPNEKIK